MTSQQAEQLATNTSNINSLSTQLTAIEAQIDNIDTALIKINTGEGV